MFAIPKLPFELPFFALPSAVTGRIQQRFLSFILRRFLGHLVKPGQLDASQIEAQIGSGAIEIRNVELDEAAVNDAITGLPLKLKSANLGSVAVRVPWQSFLTADITLAVEGLDVAFTLCPLPPSEHIPVDKLAESIISVAQEFTHEALSPQDNEELRHSIILAKEEEDEVSSQVPGALDPFNSVEDEEPTEPLDAMEGVSVLASVMERLMSRLSFNAENLTLRLIHEDRAEFIFHIDKVVYGSQTEMMEGVMQTVEVRSVQIHGVTVSVRDLTPVPPSRVPSSTTLGPPTPTTPPYHESDDDDDDDEEMDASMTQSMLSIRPDSPNASLYMSATSSIRGPSPEPDIPPPQIAEIEAFDAPTATPTSHSTTSFQPPRPECILSFGHDPIVLRLRTPQHTSQQQQTPRAPKIISVTLDIGTIALAFRPRHIKALLEATALLPSTPSQQTSNTTLPTQPPSPLISSIEATAGLRNLVLVLLQADIPSDVLDAFYDKPRSLPLKVPHIRLAIDSLDAKVSSVRQLSRTFEASMQNFSVFITHSTGPDKWAASPLLLVDNHLALQYSANGPLPQFTVNDWTGPNVLDKPKKGPWMTQVPKTTPASDSPAVLVRGELTIGSPVTPADVKIAPLHVFIYTALLDDIMDSVKGMTPDIQPIDPRILEELEDTEHIPSPFVRRDVPKHKSPSPHETPRAVVVNLPLTDSSQLERLVIDDMDDNSQRETSTGLQVLCSMIRIEVRCPSPPGREQRSGALVIDLHEIILVLENAKDPTVRRNARFADPQVGGGVGLAMDKWSPVVTFAWHQAILAFALVNDSKAKGLLSLGPLTMEDEDGHSSSKAPIIPKVYLRKCPTDPSKLGLDVQIPSINVAITKPILDGLQLWADDLTQWAERLGSREGTSTAAQSTNTSIIGSRYFVKRTASVVSSSVNTETGSPKKSEFTVKMSVLEVFGKLDVARIDGGGKERPLKIQVSDLDVLIQVKPDGKDETVVTVSVMDLIVQDTQTDGKLVTLICLTTPRSLMSEYYPLLKLVLTSLVIPNTNAKQSRIKLVTFGFTYTFIPDLGWTKDLAVFFKAPPGAFEQVVPTERTVLSLEVKQGSIKLLAPNHPGAIVLAVDGLRFDTDLVNDSKLIELRLTAAALSLLLLDDLNTPEAETTKKRNQETSWIEVWSNLGFASILHIYDLNLGVQHNGEISPAETAVDVEESNVELHLCADSLPVLISFFGDFGTLFASEEPTSPPSPTSLVKNVTSSEKRRARDLTMTYDENAFKKPPAIGPDPDMVDDDLPTNVDYIDASYGAAAGVRDITDSDLEDFDEEFGGRRTPTLNDPKAAGIVSTFGGETIKILAPEGLRIVEGYFDTLQQSEDSRTELGVSTLTVRVRESSASMNLYSGYDWQRTRKTIEDEVKAIRKRLEKIRQLLANGQTPDDSIENTNTFLFNSVYLGLPQEAEDMEGDALLNAIDAKLGDLETASQSSWQSFVPPVAQPKPTSTKRKSRRLIRSKKASIKIVLQGLNAEFDKFRDDESLASRVFATIRDLEIVDQMPTSTWDLFLTSMRADSKGNVRETESNMVRVELKNVRPIVGAPDEEARFRLKVLPIKLHVDQDALDFLKQFFSFQDTNGFVPVNPAPPGPETYFQHIEVFPVELKLDYKPKRVDYKALKEGKTIELMNFFHFEGAEMTLRHITLKGLTGWAKLGDTLNDMWTPDVKANQLADVISGVSPIRSIVNVGTGMADLVLLPIAQYRKDKRIVRGVQKGTTAFMKTTAMEAIKLGARLASGTQVILEQAENILGSGAGQDEFNHTITAETMGSPLMGSNADDSPTDEDGEAWISKYADQPESVQEGMQTAYKSLSKNLHSAAQTILAVPMEVYERSGTEGPVRAVVRAVPIAVLRPMIGASEAVSQTLWGLRNTLDPETRREMNDKYKQR